MTIMKLTRKANQPGLELEGLVPAVLAREVLATADLTPAEGHIEPIRQAVSEGHKTAGLKRNGGFDFSSLFGEDIFSQFSNGGGTGFGSTGRGAYRAQKGQDAAYSLDVDFLDAAKGAEKSIMMNGKRLNVKIPAGTASGQVLRLKGQGFAGVNGGTDGDALITINVRSHPYFRAEGKNIVMDLPVSMKEAVLGAKVIVPTISGKVSVKIPAYSSSGEKLRLKGKGIKTGDSAGDEIINLVIMAPKAKDAGLEAALNNLPDEQLRSF